MRGKREPSTRPVNGCIPTCYRRSWSVPNPVKSRSFLMRLIVYVTFTILPLITLLYFQVKFLPYHEIWITHWHRIAVIFGLAMMIFLLPIIQP